MTPLVASTGIDWLDVYKATKGGSLPAAYTNNASGWSSDATKKWAIDATTAKSLGVKVNANGKYYISGSTVAWLAESMNSTTLATDHGAAVSNFLVGQLVGKYDSAKAHLASYQRAAQSGSNAEANGFLIQALNDVMKNGPKLYSQAVADTNLNSAIDMSNYYKLIPTGEDTSITTKWKLGQQQQINDFMGFWTGAKNPAVANQIANAINGGKSAWEVQKALYTSNPKDPSNPLAAAASQFQQAFPALVQAYKKGIAIAVDSPAQYMRLKDEYTNQLRTYGLTSMFKPTDYDQMMLNHVLPSDLGKWANMAYESYQNADPTIKQALANKWGLSQEQVMAYLMLPENVGVERVADDIKAQNLYVAGKSAGVTEPDAYRLTGLMDQGMISGQQAQQAVQQAALNQNLQQQSYGMDNQTTATAQDVMSATTPEFAVDATKAVEAAQKVSQAKQEREQASKAGGQMAATQAGVIGAAPVQ